MRRIAVLGATDDAIHALPRLARDPDVEIACVYDADALVVRRRLAVYPPEAAALLQKLLTDDPSALEGLELVRADSLAARVDVEPSEAGDARVELVGALGEIADAAALVADAGALFPRLLDASIAASGASGGSLLLLQPGAEVLRVAAAVGLERELWTKVALRIGEGLAGRAWAEGRPLVVRGRADAEHFEVARERHDVASSICAPLWHGGRVRGVLCLHDARDPDRFGAGDVETFEAIGAALGRIAAQAEEARAARARALRGEVADAVRAALAPTAPLAERLAALCRAIASRAGGGIATVWWSDGEAEGALRQIATSLPGGAFGAPARLGPGDGLDGRAARECNALFLERDDRLAYAALPIADGSTLLGVVSVQLGEGAVLDEPALRALADEAARELARDRALAAARERALHADAVHEAAVRLLAERDVSRVAEQLASAAALAVDAGAAIVRVLDPVRKSFRVRARTGAAESLDEVAGELDRRGAREALRTRAPVEAPGDDDGNPAWLVVPLLAGDQAVGTLALVDKRPPAPPRFSPLDRESALRLAGYAARALAAALPLEPADPATRLVAANAFLRRLDEEIARAAEAPTGAPAFLLVACRLENAEQLDPAERDRIMGRLADAFGASLRPFDVAARTELEQILALLPEPGGAPAERVARLARALTERVAESSPDGMRPVLVFGHALHPDAGGSRAALLAAAATPRIRTL